MADFEEYLVILRDLPEVVAFKERTGLAPAVKILEMSVQDKNFGVVFTRWGRGGDATDLQPYGQDVVAFGQRLSQLIAEWFSNYRKTTMVDMFEGLEARGMDFILRVDILIF
ncbi:hypothetical protein HOLleu_27811 [Holothuria leucospilota]|nr:hypothetical protein HOLleu_27811 [Holothuria leucospilota]